MSSPDPEFRAGERYRLALQSESDLQAGRLASLLAPLLGRPRSETAVQVRRGEGVLGVLEASSARTLASSLDALEVPWFAVPEDSWPIPPRPFPASRATWSEAGLLCEAEGLEPCFLPWAALRGLFLRAVVTRKYGVKPGTAREEAEDLSTAERDLLEAVASIERKQTRRVDFIVDLLCWDPARPVCLRRSSLSYAEADQCSHHGLLNFLQLIRRLREHATTLELEARTAQFLEDLELDSVLEHDHAARQAWGEWAFARLLHREIGLGFAGGPP